MGRKQFIPRHHPYFLHPPYSKVLNLPLSLWLPRPPPLKPPTRSPRSRPLFKRRKSCLSAALAGRTDPPPMKASFLPPHLRITKRPNATSCGAANLRGRTTLTSCPCPRPRTCPSSRKSIC